MSVGGGVEVGVCECGKAWHILDTGGSVHVGVQELVCVCVCVHMGGGIFPMRVECVHGDAVCMCEE